MQIIPQRELFVSTNKAIINTLPRFVFSGKIVVIQSESEAIRAVQALRQSTLLGIDTETRPAFKKGVTHKVALLQICDGQVCFLFRLNQIGMPQCLVELLSDPSITKVGLSLKDDFLMLRHRKKFSPNGCIDIQHLVGDLGIKDMSLRKLFANIFRQKISKNAQLSNWEADVLTAAQQTYAATDAYACILLYEALKLYSRHKNYTLIENENRP